MSKVAFITGATRGIGRAIALELAKEGYNIALNYRTENEALENLKKEISEIGVECYPVQGDVSKAEDAERMTKEIIEHFEQIDVLVNNAGITKDNLILRMKEEEFTDVINVNLVGTFNITKNVIKYMTKKRKNHQSIFSSRNFRKCWTIKLCSIKSRNHWIYKKYSKRISIKKHYSKRSCTRIHSNRYDKCIKR